MTTLSIRSRSSAPQPSGAGYRLLTAETIADRIGRTPAWVRRNVPSKIMLGYNTPRWYEDEFEAWVESRRGKEGK